jgi:hypothetical protein
LVLGHKHLSCFKPIATWLTLLVSFAAFGEEIQAPVTVQVSGLDLVLGEEQGKCKISYSKLKNNGTVLSEMAAPCQVIRDHNQKPLAHTYKDLGKTAVILIVGGPPSQTQKDLYMNGGCGTQVQALMVREDSISLSKEIGKGSTFCPSAGADEKMFWFLSHK